MRSARRSARRVGQTIVCPTLRALRRADHLNPRSFIQANMEAPRESSTGSALVSDCFPVRSRRGLADALAKFERERRSEIAIKKADRRARAVSHARGQDVSTARD